MHHLEQAARCRRLATQVNDPETVSRLIKLAAEYEARAGQSSKGVGRVRISTHQEDLAYDFGFQRSFVHRQRARMLVWCFYCQSLEYICDRSGMRAGLFVALLFHLRLATEQTEASTGITKTKLE